MTINNPIRKFLRHPAPHLDESISGYLIRLAESNGYDFSEVWSLFGFGDENSPKKQPLAYIYGCADYSILSRRTGLSEKELKSLAYRPIEVDPQQFVGTYELFGHKLASRMLRYKISTLCPGCLAEDSYQKKIWDILSLTACPVHERMLIDSCPECGEPIYCRRDRICFCSCEYDFRKAEVTSVSGKELRLARRIYELCKIEINSASKPNEKIPAVLAPLDLPGLLQSLFLVSGQIFDGDIFGKFLSSISVPERHRILNEALDAYENFPVNFFKFLTSLKDVFHHRVEALGAKKTGRQRIVVYHGVTHALTKSMTGSQFEFLHQAFQEFLRREKLASYRIDLDYAKTTAEEFLQTHITLQEASRFLKNTKLANKEMIANKVLRAYEGTMPNGQPVCYVNLRDLERVKKRLTEVISAVDAARLIGVYIYQMDQLINANIISAVEDVKITPVFCRVVDRQQVLDFYDYFHRAMRKNSARNRPGKKISSKNAFIILGSHQINFGEVAKMVLNGEIAPAGRDEKKGINGFIYDEKQIQKLIEEKRKEIGKDTLSFDEAAKILGVKVRIVRILVRKKYLPFTNTKTILRKRICWETLARFQRDFIFANEISRKFSTSNEYVNRKLADKNIRPVDDEMDPYNYLYRREEVENIAIEKVSPAERTNKIRREKLCSLPEAAKRLGLSEEDLKLALKHKLIRFYKGKYRQDIKFSEKSIASFIKLNLPNVNFLREKEALEMIKIGIRSFKRKYLDKGLITPEVRPYQKNSTNRFYSIEDIAVLKIKSKNKNIVKK